MPSQQASEQGYIDGLRRAPKASSRCGYPYEYEAAYRRGLLERSRVRRSLARAGRFLLELAER